MFMSQHAAIVCRCFGYGVRPAHTTGPVRPTHHPPAGSSQRRVGGGPAIGPVKLRVVVATQHLVPTLV